MPVIWSRATRRCVRRSAVSRFRGTNARAYHEKSANDRSDSPVSAQVLRKSAGSSWRKEEGRGDTRPRAEKVDRRRSASECTRTHQCKGPRNGSTQPNSGRFLARVTRWPSFTGGEQIKRVATSSLFPSLSLTPFIRETAATLHVSRRRCRRRR